MVREDAAKATSHRAAVFKVGQESDEQELGSSLVPVAEMSPPDKPPLTRTSNACRNYMFVEENLEA